MDGQKVVFREKATGKKRKMSDGQIKLITRPLDYADGAIAVLQRQLESAKSPKRKQKLQNKIDLWNHGKNVLITTIQERMEQQKVVAQAAESDLTKLNEENNGQVEE